MDRRNLLQVYACDGAASEWFREGSTLGSTSHVIDTRAEQGCGRAMVYIRAILAR
jgi:hypothetical protein